MSSTIQKIVLDTTYILPLYGIEVDGLKDLEKNLISLLNGNNSKISLYIPSVTMLEALYKLIREFKLQDDKNILNRYPMATRSIVENPVLVIVNPLLHPEISNIALNIRSEGHTDLFDCLIAGTAIFHKAILVTQDNELERIIRNIPQYYNQQILDWKKFMQHPSFQKLE
ncbi:MAG: type II toxin-antitoxin system VapC family toxin [Promethearchaeota archaeon]|nr:MAG: type II toxin-antitoxin system VapC family toxin [Candidatus Lokiarchaeota archaeon]